MMNNIVNIGTVELEVENFELEEREEIQGMKENDDD